MSLAGAVSVCARRCSAARHPGQARRRRCLVALGRVVAPPGRGPTSLRRRRRLPAVMAGQGRQPPPRVDRLRLECVRARRAGSRPRGASRRRVPRSCDRRAPNRPPTPITGTTAMTIQVLSPPPPPLQRVLARNDHQVPAWSALGPPIVRAAWIPRRLVPQTAADAVRARPCTRAVVVRTGTPTVILMFPTYPRPHLWRRRIRPRAKLRRDRVSPGAAV
jgi:hypothetical protein